MISRKAMNGKVAHDLVTEMECHQLKAFLTNGMREVHPGACLVS